MANENPRPTPAPARYPDQVPAARAGDLETSHAAAASVTGTENLRNRIYGMLAHQYTGGLTHEQIITAYDGYVQTQGWPTATSQGIRSRVKELEREGRVRRDLAATARTTNGRRTHRWFPITDPDEQALAAANYMARRQARAVAADDDTVDPGEPRELPLTDSNPDPSESDVQALADDLRAARKAGKFRSVEMAEYLENRGWRK